MVSGKTNLSSSGSQTGSDKAPKRGTQRSAARAAKRKRPLDQSALHDLALSYVARFATTGAKLEAYLTRKLNERGIAEDGDGRGQGVDVAGLVARMVELGYVDDEAYARTRSRDLTARGYGARRIEQVLWAAGVAEATRGAHAPSELDRRRAAVALAQKRRFGAFGDSRSGVESDNPLERRKLQEKQVAAMLRAGHDYDDVRFILDASHEDEITAWLAEAEAGNGQEDSGSW